MEFTNEQLKQIAKGMVANAAKHPESVCAAADKRLYELALERLAQLEAPPAPMMWVNHCDRTVPEALRYLAEHERPIYGNSPFNAEHLYQLAGEIERTANCQTTATVEPAFQMCPHHPATAMRVNPFIVLTSYPPRPAYYCPICDPVTAAREAEHNELRGPRS